VIELKDKLENSKPHINTNPSMPKAVGRDLSDKLTLAMVRGLTAVSTFEMEAYTELIAEIKFDHSTRSSHEYFRRSSDENGI
jgi:hypothetical protein